VFVLVGFDEGRQHFQAVAFGGVGSGVDVGKMVSVGSGVGVGERVAVAVWLSVGVACEAPGVQAEVRIKIASKSKSFSSFMFPV